MNEQQFEMPAISLARYFELLKRRRWQVVPVSLLGLVIGALVAFFIPRYYVASSQLHYLSAPGMTRDQRTDPFLRVVENAALTVPLAVGDTMKALGWTEAMEPDDYQRRQNERAVEKRVDVVDANPGSGRDYAQLHIVYKDLDGRRAADFVNKLVQIWRERQIGEMRERAERTRYRTAETLQQAIEGYDRINAELSRLAQLYDFRRDLTAGEQRALLVEQERERAARLARHAFLKGEVARLENVVKDATARQDRTRKTISPEEVDLLKSLPTDPEAKEIYLAIRMLEFRLKSEYMEAHPEYSMRKAQLAELKERLRAQQSPASEDGEIANPQIAELDKEIATASQALEAAKQELEALEVRVVEDERRKDAQKKFDGEYQKKLTLLEQQKAEMERATRANRDALEVLADLDSRQPIELVHKAEIPPRPTEPNIALVAVIGSIVGLGIAIGLILLLDVVRTTFKTVDDVERALPVPVLGGMSYLETEEVRERQVAGRKRASLLAGAFVFFMVVLVMVYYVGPERLPPFARNLLSLVLGN